MANLIELQKMAEKHSTKSFIWQDSLIVIIPWVNVETGEIGEDRIPCHNAGELSKALGY